MANRPSHGAPAPGQSHPVPLALQCGRAYEAVNDILPRIMALEAIEQLMTPWKVGTHEDLASVDRASLAWLLTVVNCELRQCVEQAEALSDQARLAAFAAQEAAQ